MKNLEILSATEREMLLKFPAYITLLSAEKDEEMDEAEKKAAITFSHIKTYSCDPLLYGFYQEADRVFQKNIEQLNNELPKGKEERITAIKTELAKIENILAKLSSDYCLAMHRSMNSFKDHVSRAHHNVLVDFIFPLPIKGLTE